MPAMRSDEVNIPEQPDLANQERSHSLVVIFTKLCYYSKLMLNKLPTVWVHTHWQFTIVRLMDRCVEWTT